MSLLRRAVFLAAKRAASDPQLQAKAAEFARTELEPRAREAVEKAKPVVARARKDATTMATDLKRVAERSSPLDDPGKFVRDAARQLKIRK